MNDFFELEKVFDLKLALLHEKSDRIELRIDKLVDSIRWILAVLVIPLLMAIALLFLNKVIK